MTSQNDDLLEKRIKDLTLLLAFLTSWEEKVPIGQGVRRAWKGYDFEILDLLEKEGAFSQSRGKSLYFTEEGEQRAVELLAEYGISLPPGEHGR